MQKIIFGIPKEYWRRHSCCESHVTSQMKLRLCWAIMTSLNHTCTGRDVDQMQSFIYRYLPSFRRHNKTKKTQHTRIYSGLLSTLRYLYYRYPFVANRKVQNYMCTILNGKIGRAERESIPKLWSFDRRLVWCHVDYRNNNNVMIFLLP